MITDAAWSDIDNDGDADLTVVGEYMPITIFQNENGKLTLSKQLDKSNGWWSRIVPADVNNDGAIDFVAANHGLNSRFKASTEKPIVMYINDFDRNGNVEQIVCKYEGDSLYPLVLKHDLVNRIPELKKKYLRYESFKNETVDQIFTEEQLANSIKLEAYQMSSSLLLNDGSGNFTLSTLPAEAQFAPAYAVSVADFDGDGFADILLGGNQFRAKPEVGRYDGSYGTFLQGKGNGEFISIPSTETGLSLSGEVRDFQIIKVNDQAVVIVGKNNDDLEFISISQTEANPL
jgi:hypothetical protein